MQLVAGLAAVVISCHLCFSQAEVRVRVLDYRTAHPVQHHTVGLLLPDSAGEIRTDSVTLFAKTDRQGIAVFLLTKPLPPNIWVLPEHSLADIQEEATFLGVPCLPVRENTERPITITHGTNQLIGRDLQKLRSAVTEILQQKTHSRCKGARVVPLWDGRAAERIARIIARDANGGLQL